MALTADQVLVILDAKIDAYMRETARASAQWDRTMKSIGGAATRTEALVSTSLTRIGTAASTFLSLNAIRKYADEWTASGNRIRAAGEEGAIAARRQSEIADLAIRARSEFGATADLYAGLMRSTADLGASQADVARATETVAKAFAAGGGSAASMSGAITQLNQAMAAGRLSGDELNSILENAPPLARLIAKEFGVGIGALKKLGEDGELSADRVFKAILNGTAEIERQFATTVPTIAQSFTNLQTALTRYVGQTDQAGGTSARFALGLQTIAQNINIVAPAAAILASAMLAFSVGGPIGAGVAALATGFFLLGDSIQPIAGEIATIADYAQAAFRMAQQAGGEAAEFMRGQFVRAAELVTAALASVGTDGASALSGLLEAVKIIVNGTIGRFEFAVQMIKATWSSLGPALVATIVNAMNAVIAAVNGVLQTITTGINAVLATANAASALVSGPKIEPLAAPKLSEITNTYKGAGEAAGKAFGEAYQALSKDYVGDAVGSVQAAIERINSAANLDAESRAEQRRRDNAAGYTPQSPTGARIPALGGAGAGGGSDAGSGKKPKAERDNEFEREIAQTEERIRAFNSEREVVGKSAFEAAKAEAVHRLLTAAKKAEIPETDTLRQNIDTLAASYSSAKVELDKAEEAQRALAESLRETRADAVGFAKDFADGLRAGEGPMKALSGALDNLLVKLQDRALESAVNGLFDALLGPSGGTKGGGGGILASLFSTIGAAPVAAAKGGLVRGPGTSTSDSIPARLSDREFVVNAKATADNRDLLEDINAGRGVDVRHLIEASRIFDHAQPRRGREVRAASGGLVRGPGTSAPVAAAGGGYVRGQGTSTSDSIPARLSTGEFIINAKATRENRDLVETINAGRLPSFATGGPVGRIPRVNLPQSAVSARSGNVMQDNRRSYQIDARGAQVGVAEQIEARLKAYDGSLDRTLYSRVQRSDQRYRR